MEEKVKEILSVVARFMFDENELLDLGFSEEPLDPKTLGKFKKLLLDKFLDEDLRRREMEEELDFVVDYFSQLLNEKPKELKGIYEKVKFIRKSVEVLKDSFFVVEIGDFYRLRAGLKRFIEKLVDSSKGSKVKAKLEEIIDILNFEEDRIFSEDLWKTVENMVIELEVELEREKRVFWESLKTILNDITDAISSISSVENDDIRTLKSYVEQLESIVEKDDVEEIVREVKSIATKIRDRIVNMANNFNSLKKQLESSYKIIGNLKSEVEKQRELAIVDELTKVYNRRGLMQILKRELSAMRRHLKKLTVSLIDFDDFKWINDNFGHTVGDKVLVHVVNIIKEGLRSTDVVGRYGGDEFVIVMPETSLQDARKAIERIRLEINSKKFKIKDSYIKVSVSIGMCEAKPEDDEESLLARLSSAVRKAKTQGKGIIVVVE
ncbi:MAG: GGDEF domain-containing protein [Thermosulfidibacteraceae bacterium]